MSVILEHVSKAYGRQKALDDIGFRLEEGEICGFLGPNGAGKSTTMKIITGCLNDYQGEVRIKEMNLRENPLKIKAIIGYLPEQKPTLPGSVYPGISASRDPALSCRPACSQGECDHRANRTRAGNSKKNRTIIEGIQAESGISASFGARSRDSDPGRTDDGTRSEPTGRDQAFDQRNRKKEDGVVIDPYYAGGRSDL